MFNDLRGAHLFAMSRPVQSDRSRLIYSSLAYWVGVLLIEAFSMLGECPGSAEYRAICLAGQRHAELVILTAAALIYTCALLVRVLRRPLR